MGLKIFVAGATGAVGRPLVRLLTEAGHQVIGMTSKPEREGLVAALGAKPVVANVYDRDKLRAVVASERPEVIVHQITDLSELDVAANSRIRIDGTRNLM